MIIARSLCLLALTAGAIGAQTFPIPPQRPQCNPQPSSVRHPAQLDGPRVVAPGFPGSTSVGVSISGSSRAAQALVDEIFSLRRARRDSAAVAELQRQRAEGPIGYPATVMVADRLAHSTALAEVIRRGHPAYEDLVVLPRSGLTLAAFGGALHALGNMRRATTEAPWVAESTFVTAPYVPSDSMQLRFDQWAIDGLRRARPIDIAGFGLVPACAIEITSRPPRRRTGD